MSTPTSTQRAATPPSAPLPAPAAPAGVRGIVSFGSSQSRSGRWPVPPHLRVAAVCGTVELDLRDAALPPGGAVIEVAAVLASVEVIAPPTMRVECDGEALGGTFAIEKGRPGSVAGAPPAPPPDDAPGVRITGHAYGATVSVWVCAPGEHPADVHRR